MKNFILSLAVMISTSMFSQISLNHTHSERRFLTKLDYGGYVFYSINPATETIDLFDPGSNTLINAIAVPNFTTADLTEIYLSDNLFDTDNLIEFLLFRVRPNNTLDLEIYNELGTLIFSATNCAALNYISGSMHIPVFRNDNMIFFDGMSAKMRVAKVISPYVYTYEVYYLPGSLPCIECSPGGVTVGNKSNKISKSEVNFFPNPVKDEERLKLNYSIPATTKNARVKIYDMNGKLMDDLRISSGSDYILLPSSYDNGLYLYSLEIDGKVIKNEKIILDK
ncbi:T9SS type A sorting domain-containing protein [Aurantibacillus circumpalustris]|uniref:T9SS type A sorting domain-containing protein n=1 Tax=Aurantibacillus circumpalustris TaxID=3036359 RepID=UPI00295ADAD0|nr:T9SS type A sorting domain-containing protein [Aurantibacillus circumpalustris]